MGKKPTVQIEPDEEPDETEEIEDNEDNEVSDDDSVDSETSEDTEEIDIEDTVEKQLINNKNVDDEEIEQILNSDITDDNKKSESDSNTDDKVQPIVYTKINVSVEYKSFLSKIKNYDICDFLDFVVNGNNMTIIGCTKDLKIYIQSECECSSNGFGEIPVSDIAAFTTNLDELKGSVTISINFDTTNIEISGDTGVVAVYTPEPDSRYFKMVSKSKEINDGLHLSSGDTPPKISSKKLGDYILNNTLSIKAETLLDLMRNSVKLKSKYHVLVLTKVGTSSQYKHVKSKEDIIKPKAGVTKNLTYESINITKDCTLIFDSDFMTLIKIFPEDIVEIRYYDESIPCLIKSPDNSFVAQIFPTK